MDLSDLHPDTGKAHNPAALASDLDRGETFRGLLGQLGREVAAPMTSALQRVNAFATSGRMDRAGLRALREELECARRIASSAQQLCRITCGRVRQQPVRMDLTQALRDALARRARETAARGIDLRQDLQHAQVLADAPMLSALLQCVLDWSFEHARSHIEFRIDVKAWPARARLGCRFAYIPADQASGDAAHGTAQRLDTIAWQLLCRLAQALGLVVLRNEAAGSTQLTLEFPHTVDAARAALVAPEFDDGPAAAADSQPMLGRHVLVIASRRETRNCLREAFKPMGLMVDYVDSVDEARQFCSGALPHAIVFEAALAGENFHKLRAAWSREVPSLAFIEIAEQGRGLEISDLGGQRTSRIGRDVIVNALPNALMFELAKAA